MGDKEERSPKIPPVCSSPPPPRPSLTSMEKLHHTSLLHVQILTFLSLHPKARCSLKRLAQSPRPFLETSSASPLHIGRNPKLLRFTKSSKVIPCPFPPLPHPLLLISLVLSFRANPPFPMHNALIECLQR